jgi:hypothetical protein
VKAARKPKPRPGPRATAAPVFVRLTPEERREVVEAAERAALPIGVWARSILVRAARGSGVPDRKEDGR